MAINQDTTLKGYQYTSQNLTRHIKTLAYADDICVILHAPDDFYRLQAHLQQYSQVSNAKFNQSKTEAFSLRGRPDPGWQRLLTEQSIATYYTHRSLEPFRYLGYYMVYTVDQRNIIQVKLLTDVRNQVRLYSARTLSLRGRATIINTLILTKVWYCLRLLQPTKAFLNSLQSIIYNYVWQQKRPLVSFNQLRRPFSQGGVGLIAPEDQHLVLQIRHLRHLFQDTGNSPLVGPFLQYHLSLVTPEAVSPAFSIFIPEWRKHDLNHPTSIIHACYKAFDRFKFQPDFSLASLPLLLQLPLKDLFVSVPSDHWLHRHPRFLASQFFVLDPIQQRLRLQIETEYNSKPQLCKRLKKQVLELRTIQLQPYLWPFILNNLEKNSLITYDGKLMEQFQRSSAWRQFQPVDFRNIPVVSVPPAIANISAKALLSFWSLPMLLQARSLWYRVLSRKIPHSAYLHQIETISTNSCRLCHLASDSLDHFIFLCPIRHNIWMAVLNRHFPTFRFSQTDLFQILFNLKAPFSTRSSLYPVFMPTVSTTLWCMWANYWQLVMKDVPFNSEVVIRQSLTQIRTLLSADSDFD